ncbi:MAG TPA: putative quinol monooxygenase [Candidatus Dormibacteraeota bacterium]|jgi:quinol monooxygenase YgiN
MPYVAAVTWTARAGTEQRVEEILAEMVVPTRAEPGCLMYEVHRSVDRPRVYFLYEQFVNEAAFILHIDSEPYKRLIVGDAVTLLEHRERVLYTTVAFP